MIQERVRAGLARAKEHGTKSGKPICRPPVPLIKIATIRELQEQGLSIRNIAKKMGISRTPVRSHMRIDGALREIEERYGPDSVPRGTTDFKPSNPIRLIRKGKDV